MESFILLLAVYPVVSIILGLLGEGMFRKIYLMPGIVAVSSIIMKLTIYNLSFFIWTVVYTFLTFISGMAARHLITNKRKGMSV
ncbi:DUF2651 family protein [Halobacillus sp. B23F22_1]|uniref:DUF2651 family protein n=1 Tax=Halobacillus sp. B23F22_1 TaxID=3459514 RepID=UPI00373FBCF2